MLLCVDLLHTTGWHFFVFFFLGGGGNFYREHNQMHAGVNSAFFKPDGRIFSDFFFREHYVLPPIARNINTTSSPVRIQKTKRVFGTVRTEAYRRCYRYRTVREVR